MLLWIIELHTGVYGWSLGLFDWTWKCWNKLRIIGLHSGWYDILWSRWSYTEVKNCTQNYRTALWFHMTMLWSIEIWYEDIILRVQKSPVQCHAINRFKILHVWIVLTHHGIHVSLWIIQIAKFQCTIITLWTSKSFHLDHHIMVYYHEWCYHMRSFCILSVYYEPMLKNIIAFSNLPKTGTPSFCGINFDCIC